MTRKAWLTFAIVLGLTAAADQSSKAWARGLPTSPPGCTTAELAAQRCGGVPQPVIAGYWDWELAENPGAAFSSVTGGGTGGRIALALLAAVALVAIGVVAGRSAPDAWRKRAALALIAGGALGNLVDRVRDGAVTDFIRWRVHEHRWPIFNVADAALLVGVLLLTLRNRARSPESRGAPPAGAMLTA
jgi:signal peptidase II